MNHYLKKLILFSFIISLVVYLIHFVPVLDPFLEFIRYATLFFTLLSTLIYRIVSAGIKNKNSNSFITSVYVAMMIKMIFCVIAVLSYYFIVKPGNIYFVIPFFIFYILYTVFETFVLVKESAKSNLNTQK